MSKLSDLLQEKKSTLLSTYVSVSTALVGYLVAPLSKFMEHLLVIQGINPKTKPTDLATKIAREHFDVTFPVMKFAKPLRYKFGDTFFPTKNEDPDTGSGVTIHIPRDFLSPAPKQTSTSSIDLKEALKTLVKYASKLEANGHYPSQSKAAESFKNGLFRRVFETKK